MRASSRADEGFAPQVTRLRRRSSSVCELRTGTLPGPHAQDATSTRKNGPRARFTALTGLLSFAVPTSIQRRGLRRVKFLLFQLVRRSLLLSCAVVVAVWR